MPFHSLDRPYASRYWFFLSGVDVAFLFFAAVAFLVENSTKHGLPFDWTRIFGEHASLGDGGDPCDEILLYDILRNCLYTNRIDAPVFWVLLKSFCCWIVVQANLLLHICADCSHAFPGQLINIRARRTVPVALH